MIDLFIRASTEIKVRKRAARKRALMRARFGTFILSFPNSGRTWHHIMLGSYLARLTGVPYAKAMQLEQLCPLAGIERVKYSHNGVSHSSRAPASRRVVADPGLWRGRKVMLLVREPKAILVSSYHHARFRISLFDGTLSEFIRDPRWGIDKIMTAYTRWHANRRQASAFIVCSYEKMHKNPEDVLRQTLHLIGIPSPDERIMAEAVKFGRFDNMKAYESTDFFSDPKIRRLNKEVRVEANKVREGKTDSYKNHLSEEDSAYIDKRLAQLGGNPFAAECAIL